MLFPDYEEFSRMARTSTLVPVAKTVAADLRTPVSAFLSIAADEPNAFLLESVEVERTKWARMRSSVALISASVGTV